MTAFFIGFIVAIISVILVILARKLYTKRYETFSVPGPYDDSFWRLPKNEQQRHYIGHQEARVYASWWEFLRGKSVFNKPTEDD